MFGHRLTLFTLFGFQVRVDASWIILAGILTWSLAAGYFPVAAPNLSPVTHWGMGVVGTLGLACSVLLHELAHAIMARRHSMRIGVITLFIFGGVAEMEGEPESARAELWMALAGPVMSLALSLVLLGLTFLLDHHSGASAFAVQQILIYLALLNGVLAAFNMVPAFPMDGGRVLRAALWAWRGDLLWATKLATGAGTIFAVLIMGFGAYQLASGEFLVGVWWCLIGYFVRSAANSAYKLQLEQTLLGNSPVERFLRRDPVTASPDMPVTELVERIFFRHFRRVVGVTEHGRLLGLVSVEDLNGTTPAAWDFRRVKSIMTPCPPDALVALGVPAGVALQQLRRCGRQRLYVHLDGIVQGEIVLRDIVDYLALRVDLREPEVTRFFPAPPRISLGRDFG
jgi:Zn-dependent protease